jgi:hypothetical protein
MELTAACNSCELGVAGTPALPDLLDPVTGGDEAAVELGVTGSGAEEPPLGLEGSSPGVLPRDVMLLMMSSPFFSVSSAFHPSG